jgi:hypothetical protein
MAATPASESGMPDALTAQMIQTSTVTMNIGQKTIVVTEDRLELCLMKNFPKVVSKEEILAPIGFVLTIAITLTTSEFKDKWLSKSTWQAMFVVALIASFGWTIGALLRLRERMTISEVISLLKTEGAQRVTVSPAKNGVQLDAPEPVATSTRHTSAPQCSVCGTLLGVTAGKQVCPQCGTVN